MRFVDILDQVIDFIFAFPGSFYIEIIVGDWNILSFLIYLDKVAKHNFVSLILYPDCLLDRRRDYSYIIEGDNSAG